MTKKYYSLTLSAFMLVVTIVMFGVFAGAAWPASLKVCFKDIPLDASDINLYVNTTRTVGLFPGQMQSDGSVCATISPLPAPVLRGTTQSYTLRGMNSIGEEGPASNALSFRYPALPTAPTLMSVGAVVP